MAVDKHKPSNTSNTEEFIKKAKTVHGDVYDYSKVVYVRAKDKVVITCSAHGEFSQTPNDHLSGYGCRKCGRSRMANKQTYTREEFEKAATEVHGSKYDYSKAEYIQNSNKRTIVCPTHGEFQQSTADHLNGRGCEKCAIENSRMSLEEFVTRAAKVHQSKYDYSKVEYTASKEKVTITCPVHGDFEQSARGHLAGRGCRECNKNSGWSYSSWKAAGERSVLFDGFKLYVVKMWDENTKETFYKIGKTFTTVYQRFKSNGYRFEVLYTIEADAVTICELEHKYQKENSENKYSPSVQFSGHTECFTKVELKDRGLSYGC